MWRTFERAFVVVTVAMVVLGGAAAIVAPTQADEDRPIAFDAPTPAEFEFAEPSADGLARVDGESFRSVAAAVDAAEPGDTVVLTGRFTERVVVDTPDLTITSAPGSIAAIDGGGEGNVLTLQGDGITVRRLWIRNSGYDPAENDAGIWVNSSNARIVDSRVSASTFGVWVDGVDGVVVRNNTIVGREEVRPPSHRGNGVQLWDTEGTLVEDNRITDVRDGIYYSWATDVLARGNTMWDLRFGVHYMYSDDCRLEDNLAFDNDVGYALMVSADLEIVDNVAVNNTGQSGQGVLLKDIDDTIVRNNSLVGNRKGLFIYNSLNNTIAGNLVLANDLGVHVTAGSVEEYVYGNSFIRNDQPMVAVMAEQVAWNATGRGNYWSNARTVDLDRDDVSEVPYQPAGVVEYTIQQHPQAIVFAYSPAFDAIRLAESSFPVVESPGVVDHHPLVDPPHEEWRRYYGDR